MKQMIAALLLIPLSACVPAGDNIGSTTGGGGVIAWGSSSGAASSGSSRPMAPTGGELLAMKQFDPMTETREWHAAASSADCNNIARRLKSQGLKVFLADRQRRNDSLLPIACIFEGPDADPHAERFLSPQHNNH